MPQKTGDEINRPIIPKYSVENPSFGATMEYTGMTAIQITIDPGIAITAYFVHRLLGGPSAANPSGALRWMGRETYLVTSAAFPKTVAKTAV